MSGKSASWADVTRAKRKATTRILVQMIWALTNTTDLSNDDINGVLDYVHEQQDSFNKGYINYKDILKALYTERGLDLRGLESML